ncbi:MAG: cyclomaltodextrinase N-terminal domain-containing protein, partial [Tidjanibacter sp.]|nr:cyclomaltodextrinase N-terminal domain-containing protein [Tidjanibacter sp.]
MKRLLLTLSAVLCALSMMAQKVDHVEPLSWWTNMKTPLQLMLHGEQIADCAISVEGEGLKIKQVIKTDNPNYLFVDVDVVEAGDYTFTLTKGRKKESFAYHIDTRREGSAQRESFSSKDVVYLIMPDRFANGDASNDTVAECAEPLNRTEPFGRHGGDIQGIIDHLDYIADLGATAIWSTPLTLDNEGFASYHGYSCSDYYHIDPRYGSNELYKEMVAEAHKRGIKFIFDVVTNHCGTAHWWAGDYPTSDWAHNIDSPSISNHGWMMQSDPVNRSERDHKMMENGWFDYSMPDLNLENPLVFNYFRQLYCWWIEWADLDGLRVDTFPYNEKWSMARWTRSILEEYPNLNIVGECWNSVPAICAYWEGDSNNRDGYSSGLPSVMDFPLQEKLAQGLSSHPEGWMCGGHGVYASLMQDFLYGNPNTLLTFHDNHDNDRFADIIKADLKKYKIDMAIIAT